MLLTSIVCASIAMAQLRPPSDAQILPYATTNVIVEVDVVSIEGPPGALLVSLAPAAQGVIRGATVMRRFDTRFSGGQQVALGDRVLVFLNQPLPPCEQTPAQATRVRSASPDRELLAPTCLSATDPRRQTLQWSQIFRRQMTETGIATMLTSTGGLGSQWSFVVRAECRQPVATQSSGPAVMTWTALVDQVQACAQDGPK